MIKCPECNAQFKKKPYKNKDGSWNWKNIMLPDLDVVFFCLVVILLLFAYKSGTAEYEHILEKPDEFCESRGYISITPWEKNKIKEINFTSLLESWQTQSQQ